MKPFWMALFVLGGVGCAAEEAPGSVDIVNLSVRLDRKYSCDSTSDKSCADYAISFILKNSSAANIDRVERVEFRLGELDIRTSLLACSGSPWDVNPGEFSDTPIDMSVGYVSEPATTSTSTEESPPPGPPALVFECGSSRSEVLELPLATAPLEGVATLQLSGLFEDALFWTTMSETALLNPFTEEAESAP